MRILRHVSEKGIIMIQTLKNLYWLSRSYKWTIVAATFGALIVQILGLVAPIVVGRMINLLETDAQQVQFAQAVWYIGLLVASLLLLIVVDMLADVAIFRVLFGMEGKLSADALDHLMTLPLGYHEREDTGSSMKKIQRGAEKTVLLIARWGWGGIPSLLLFATTIVVLMYLHMFIGLAVLVSIPVTIGIHMYFHSRTQAPRDTRNDGYEASESVLLQAVSNVATVQSYRQEATESRRLKKIWDTIYEAGYREFRLDMVNYGFRGGIKSLLTAALIMWTFAEAYRGVIDTGQFALMVMLIWRVDHNIWFLGDVMAETTRDSASIDRLRALMETQSEVVEVASPRQLNDPKGRIDYVGVTFRHNEADANPALVNVRAELPAGKTTALVGPSGGGKSTFVKLLLRAYDPQEGSVQIDGHDLRTLALDYRRHIGYVPQEPQIFDLTIAENIAYGNRGLTQQAIENAAQMAHVDEFVERLPKGYHTPVGEHGVRLSGGQKQRLAIARAIAVDPVIFVLDEATSHLDSISEQLIQDSLAQIAGTRTVIVIAHRLSTIKAADQILVFREGAIIESGTHESLQRRDGVYRQLVGLQDAGELMSKS